MYPNPSPIVEPAKIERRRDRRCVPADHRRVRLQAAWGAREGVLWDVSAHGAKILFPKGNYLRDEEKWSLALERESPLIVTLEGDSYPRGVVVRWHGLAAKGGYVMGVELLPFTAPFPAGSSPAARIEVPWCVFGRGGRVSWLRKE